MLSKFFIGIILINMSLINCSLSGGSKKMDNEEIKEVCQAFAKAICTKDTVMFYKLVDKEDLTISMNEWITDGKKLTQDNIFFPFFFVFGPLKIRHEDLMNERNKEIFFSDFKIENKKVTDEFNVWLSVEWIQNFSAAEPQKIELNLKKNNLWKIVRAKWKTL